MAQAPASSPDPAPRSPAPSGPGGPLPDASLGSGEAALPALPAVPLEFNASYPGCPFPLLELPPAPCPYLPERVWHNLVTLMPSLPAAEYEGLLNLGFRRTGSVLYRPRCQGCASCIPIRIDVRHFKPSKGQRRTWRKNQDLRMEHVPPSLTREEYLLYQRYQEEWHADHDASPEAFWRAFVEPPVPAEAIRYYLEDRLVAVGWVDLLPSVLSSVYFVFEPEWSARRLGVFSILYEIEYCRRLGLSWLYLGYWVPGSAKMQYKADYRPAEVLVGGVWQPFEEFAIPE